MAAFSFHQDEIKIKHFWHLHALKISYSIFAVVFISTIALIGVLGYSLHQQNLSTTSVKSQLQKSIKDLEALRSQDQFKRNEDLQKQITAIENTYTKAEKLYDSLAELRSQTQDTSDLDTQFAAILALLAKRDYNGASDKLNILADAITKEQQKIAAASLPAPVNTASAPASNAPPSSGYSRQSVTTDTGTFVVDIIAADLNSTRVIVDTASDSDCSNNCPTLPLGTYVSRSGAYAGINGTFFCPAEYPSCAGKTGSFDTLLMNKNKYYFNSSNNVYSTVPLVYFTGSQMGVRAHTSDWGRDTSVDSVIAMQPLLVLDKQIVYSDSSDTKFTNKGTRDFIANKGSTVYIGVMYNANMTDSAHVLHTLNMDNALNLDEGGSTALMLNGSYLAGPGRNIPNAVLFVRK